MDKIVFGYDLYSPEGEIPNGFYIKHFGELQDESWYLDRGIKKVKTNLQENSLVNNSNFYNSYVEKKSVYDIVRDRQGDNEYDWYYLIEPYATFRTTFLDKISKQALTEIRNYKGKLLISFIQDGGFGVDQDSFEVLLQFIRTNNISEDKVYLIFQDFKLEENLTDTFDTKYNFYNFNLAQLHKSQEFNTILHNPGFDGWSGKIDQVGRLYGEDSIQTHNVFLENITEPKKDFLFFTRHWKLERLLMISHIHKLGLDKSKVSWTNKPMETGPSVSKKLIDEFLSYDNNEEVVDLLMNTSSVLDIQDITGIEGYGYESKELYTQTYISDVGETLFFQDDNFPSGYLSEKIWKPIGHSHPFVLLAPAFSLKYIKEEFGYLTFGDYIDESYDEEVEDWKRLEKVKQVMTEFSERSVKDKVNFLKQVSSILKHNQDLFFSMNSKQYIDKVLNFLR